MCNMFKVFKRFKKKPKTKTNISKHQCHSPKYWTSSLKNLDQNKGLWNYFTSSPDKSTKTIEERSSILADLPSSSVKSIVIEQSTSLSKPAPSKLFEWDILKNNKVKNTMNTRLITSDNNSGKHYNSQQKQTNKQHQNGEKSKKEKRKKLEIKMWTKV